MNSKVSIVLKISLSIVSTSAVIIEDKLMQESNIVYNCDIILRSEGNAILLERIDGYHSLKNVTNDGKIQASVLRDFLCNEFGSNIEREIEIDMQSFSEYEIIDNKE